MRKGQYLHGLPCARERADLQTAGIYILNADSRAHPDAAANISLLPTFLTVTSHLSENKGCGPQTTQPLAKRVT